MNHILKSKGAKTWNTNGTAGEPSTGRGEGAFQAAAPHTGPALACQHLQSLHGSHKIWPTKVTAGEEERNESWLDGQLLVLSLCKTLPELPKEFGETFQEIRVRCEQVGKSDQSIWISNC